MGCDVFARLPQTDERRMVSSTTTTVKLLCKRWQQLKRKACNYLRSIAPPRRRIAPRGRGWAEQQYEQQGGVEGGSIMVYMIHMVHIMVHILSRWGKHYGTQHILSRGCKQVELRRVWQQFCKNAILTISIIPRGFSEFWEYFFFIPFPFPNYGNGFFFIPFPFPKCGNGFFHSLPIPEFAISQTGIKTGIGLL